MEPTHAGFFSGVGGLDMGLKRAGWRTVSFSEIDPYASAVLAERWPGVPNLGCIRALAGHVEPHARHRVVDKELRCIGGDGLPLARRNGDAQALGPESDARGSRLQPTGGDGAWERATLWTGGFPCQDLSVAGKRRGMVEGSRSNLAHAFLDLVDVHRPPAILLENVPGLLSSHAGRDLGTLLGRLVELGYGWAYRVLDAQHFGVPQRRRRVFIVGIHSRIDPAGQRAAEVLSVGTRCGRHPATGHEAGPDAAGRASGSADLAGAVDTNLGHHGGAWGDQSVAAGHVIGVDISHALTVSNTTGRLDSNGETFVVGTLRVGASGAGSGGSGHASPVGVASRGVDVQRTVEQAGLGDGGSAVPDPVGANPERHIEPAAGHPSGLVGPAPDADRDRAPDGLAGRAHDRDGVAATLNSGGNNGWFRTEPGEHLVVGTLREHVRPGSNTDHSVVTYRKATKAHEADGLERWERTDVTDTLDANAMGAVAGTAIIGTAAGDDPMLPIGLDSHRYRCCGNGVVADVAEWIGRRLMDAL